MAVAGSHLFSSRSQRWLPFVLLALLLGGCGMVVWPFATAIVWSIVLAYVTWPLYRRGRRWLGNANALAAFLMTVAVSAAVILPILWLLILVHSELLVAFRSVAAWLSKTPLTLPTAVRDIPGVGPRIAAGLTTLLGSPVITPAQVAGWLQRLAGPVAALLGGVSRNIGKLVVSLLMLFFLYRDGDRIVAQGNQVMRHLGMGRFEPYVAAAGAMTRAVLYGFLVTALAQGLVAGIGYRIAGLNASVLLGALTAMLSILPLFGTALVWVPVAGWLLASGDIGQGIFLLAWGTLLVHPTDNLLHPLLISSSAHAPFPVILLGVLGGLAVFGLVGIIVGPVLLGIALVLWFQWGGRDDLAASLPSR
jgi:predicted PurR-regulated permease PerM